MIRLENAAQNHHIYKKGEYAAVIIPTMRGGKIYADATFVVLIEKANQVGSILKYILPGQSFAVRPHHLSRIKPIAVVKQGRAAECFRTIEFFENPSELVSVLESDSASGSLQE